MDTIRALEEELGEAVMGLPCDITNAGRVTSTLTQIKDRFGPVDILVNHASGGSWKGLMQIRPEEFERAWKVSALGALHCSRVVGTDMLTDERGGTILFTGATSSIRGREGAIDFSSAKFAVRGMADAMARELWPLGVHVAHVLIDGVIASPENREEGEPLLEPEEIADVYWVLVNQRPSAWTFELEVRPFSERFNE
jgi:NAD(P)-dependent dehydrogenase (short-subunit alcohol dehydrogenase family)